jgi:glycosyltransferase involved in cell wall biosynthesis
MLSFIVPTLDRPSDLAQTLVQISRLDGARLAAFGGAEVVVVDNASRFPPTPPGNLPNGVGIRMMYLRDNAAAASRNIAAAEARGDWLVMLDDDSAPLDTNFIDVLEQAPSDVAAIGAEITLPDGSHEWGGLPEVFIGCGVAIRRDVFLELDGYDPHFGYYAEEYDLAARMLISGYRVLHARQFRVEHRKVAHGRDMNAIVRRLVRNNAWVVHRHAPATVRDAEMGRVIERYGMIARREDAEQGFELGLQDLRSSLADQPRHSLSTELYERFIGLSHARHALHTCSGRDVAVIAPGKNEWVVRQALGDVGGRVVPAMDAEALVIGTLSPGPILDAVQQHHDAALPVHSPWTWPEAVTASSRSVA